MTSAEVRRVEAFEFAGRLYENYGEALIARAEAALREFLERQVPGQHYWLLGHLIEHRDDYVRLLTSCQVAADWNPSIPYQAEPPRGGFSPPENSHAEPSPPDAEPAPAANGTAPDRAPADLSGANPTPPAPELPLPPPEPKKKRKTGYRPRRNDARNWPEDMRERFVVAVARGASLVELVEITGRPRGSIHMMKEYVASAVAKRRREDREARNAAEIRVANSWLDPHAHRGIATEEACGASIVVEGGAPAESENRPLHEYLQQIIWPILKAAGHETFGRSTDGTKLYLDHVVVPPEDLVYMANRYRKDAADRDGIMLDELLALPA